MHFIKHVDAIHIVISPSLSFCVNMSTSFQRKITRRATCTFYIFNFSVILTMLPFEETMAYCFAHICRSADPSVDQGLSAQ